MRIHVLINSAAGTVTSGTVSTEGIESEFRRHGVEAKVELVEPSNIESATRQALNSDANVIVAGGGDGTIRTVAGLVADSGKALGVLPLGTLNHLTKELGIPQDLPGAIAALVRGSLQNFATGEVNGCIFLNTSGIGLYADSVRHRDAQRRARGRGKWWAMVVAFFKMLSRFPLFNVRLHIGQTTLRRTTPLLVVALGSNHQHLFGLEEFACPDRSALSVYVAKSLRRWGMLLSTLRALLRIPDLHRDLDAMCIPAFEIATRRKHLRVALDGEVVDLQSPLRYRIRPNALRMLMPHRQEA